MDDIPVEKIVRSQRRTISIEVTPRATLIVRAPTRVAARHIEELICEKRTWILRKMDEMRRRPAITHHEYAEGETFLFLGRAYPLHFVENGSGIIQRTDCICACSTLLPDICHRMKRWYMQEAVKEIRSRCMWFSMMTGYTPATIRITDACQRWGSCTHRGGLNFSWRLIQAPLDIVDYVIVHELVHLRQPDHSRKFWNKVREILPDYEERRNWLRENERLLRI